MKLLGWNFVWWLTLPLFQNKDQRQAKCSPLSYGLLVSFKPQKVQPSCQPERPNKLPTLKFFLFSPLNQRPGQPFYSPFTSPFIASSNPCFVRPLQRLRQQHGNGKFCRSFTWRVGARGSNRLHGNLKTGAEGVAVMGGSTASEVGTG